MIHLCKFTEFCATRFGRWDELKIRKLNIRCPLQHRIKRDWLVERGEYGTEIVSVQSTRPWACRPPPPRSYCEEQQMRNAPVC